MVRQMSKVVGHIATSGAMHLRIATAARDYRKEPTPSEDTLWRALRGRRLDGCKFRRQQPIGPFIVDFFCAGRALIVEVDGSVHATQEERDTERQAVLEACGYRVLRIGANQVEQDTGVVLALIRDALVHQATLPQTGLPIDTNGAGYRSRSARRRLPDPDFSADANSAECLRNQSPHMRERAQQPRLPSPAHRERGRG